ncbi:MAG: SDR family oxidoreductase [Anaerolineae bacterium]|nr:MAG: SDR family oxidoreductase [Anaerolineae bacterium]
MAIKDRVVVVAGATGGLGGVVCAAFAAQGARLALLGRDEERLQAVADELGLKEDRALPHVIDVSNAEAAEACAAAVQKKWGRVDVYLHLVGGWAGGKPLPETPADDLTSMLDQHVWSTFHMAHAFVPRLVANGWGRIMAVVSPGGRYPAGKASAYAAGKAAQEALLLSLAQELKGTGVTSNILLVRTIDTKHERVNAPSEKNASNTLPEELAAMMVNLCSDEAGTINGARIPLFGGPEP